MAIKKLTTPVCIATLALSLTACSVESLASEGDIEVVVGYQSKTINTVTAGTLLRAQGYFESELDKLGERTGDSYRVRWQDYDTGAPITAEMIAGKIDIGSMGDYPLLINGSRSRSAGQSPTQMLSVTGYDSKGSLNSVVVREDSPLRDIADLAGRKVSASVGSAGHGLLLRGLAQAGVDPASVSVQNQQPQIGASALESKQVDALSQFVAWPGQLVHQGGNRLLYNGAETNTPTLHGVVATSRLESEQPDVTKAFLRAQIEASDFLEDNPVEAAEIVADNAGLPAEVVYLYNGPTGTAFDPALRSDLIEKLGDDFDYLDSIGEFTDLDLDEFVDDGPLREVYGDLGRNYSDEPSASASWSIGQAENDECGNPVTSEGVGGEVWIDGQAQTRVAATTECLLQTVQHARENGESVRAAYVRDGANGTRWFADHSVWVREHDTFTPFSTESEADGFVRENPGATVIDFDTAVSEVAS